MKNICALKSADKKRAIKSLEYWKHSPHFAAEMVDCLHAYDVLHILWQMARHHGRDYSLFPALHGPRRPRRLADH